MTWDWQQHLGLSRHGAPALAALALLLLAWWSLLLQSPQNTRPLKISASTPETAVSYWHTHTHTEWRIWWGVQWHCCQCSQLWNHSGLKSWLCPDWDSHSCTDCCHYTRLQFIQKSFAFKVGFSRLGSELLQYDSFNSGKIHFLSKGISPENKVSYLVFLFDIWDSLFWI